MDLELARNEYQEVNFNINRLEAEISGFELEL